MKTLKMISLVILAIIVVAGSTLFIIRYLRPKPGGILVDTSPASGVYIDNNYVGKTPFQKTQAAGEITLKLVPIISDQNLLPFETKITLIPGVQTVVRREFGKTEDESSGDIVSFEEESGNTTGLVVISTPDNAQVSLDGIPRGFAPYKTATISPASHQITVKAPGYIDRIMTLNTKSGYRMTLFAKLAKATEIQTATPTPEPTSFAFVTILTTPTGYLRVRTEPGTKGEEIGQVQPGQKFPYLNTDSETGWYQIQYEEPTAGLPNGIRGWISNQFAKINNLDSTPSASIKPTPTSSYIP
jgi:uncharacterized protein YgiM (DUF1202 family)